MRALKMRGMPVMTWSQPRPPKGRYQALLSLTLLMGMFLQSALISAYARDISISDHGAICDGTARRLASTNKSKSFPNYGYKRKDKNKTVDWAGIQSAVNAAAPGDRITFPPGAQCIVNHYVTARGSHHFFSDGSATLKLAPLSDSYHAMVFLAEKDQREAQSVIWDGINLDGDQLRQIHPLGENGKFRSLNQGGTKAVNRKTWNQRAHLGNCGVMCMIGPYQETIVKNMRVDRAIGDGVTAVNAKRASFLNVRSSGNARLNYGKMEHQYGFGVQGTAFKCRVQNSASLDQHHECHIENAIAEDGSIAFQFSTPPKQRFTATQFHLKNAVCNDMAQNCVHLEHAAEVFVDGLSGACAALEGCHLDLFIGTQTSIATLANVGSADAPLGRIDLRNASNLKECAAENIRLINNMNDRPAIRRCHKLRDALIDTAGLGVQSQHITNATIKGAQAAATLQPATIENSRIHCRQGAQTATPWRNPVGVADATGARLFRVTDTTITDCYTIGRSMGKITALALSNLEIKNSGPIILSQTIKDLSISNLRIKNPTGETVFACPHGFHPKKVRLDGLRVTDHNGRPLAIPLGCNDLTKTKRQR